MKTEFLALAGQREQQVMRRKGEQTKTLKFLSVFSCSSNMLVCWFRLHRFVSGVGPLFGAHPKNGAVIFVLLYFIVADVQLASSHPAANSLLIPVCPLLRSGVEERTYLFPVVLHLRRRFRTSEGFSRHFSYRSLYVCFFLLFFLFSLLPMKLASRSLYNLDLAYHVTSAYVVLLIQTADKSIIWVASRWVHGSEGTIKKAKSLTPTENRTRLGNNDI